MKYLFGEEAPEPQPVQQEEQIPSEFGDFEDVFDWMSLTGRHQFDNLSVVSFDAWSEVAALYHNTPDTESELLEATDAPL